MSRRLLELTDESWEREVLRREGLVLVDFWAPWCAPCERIAPLVEDLAERHAGAMAAARLNVDEHPGPGTRYDVLSLPTLILFRDGEPVARVVGAVKAGAVEAALAPHLNPAPA